MNLPVVPLTHASVQPFAMMIKAFHTFVANSTMFHSGATARQSLSLIIIHLILSEVKVIIRCVGISI